MTAEEHGASPHRPSHTAAEVDGIHRRCPGDRVRRIFGKNIEVIHLSHVGKTVAELVGTLRELAADAIVLASAPPAHRQAIMGLANEALILHPVREQYRTHRGEQEWRVLGFGLMRADGPALLADGALAERAAIERERRRGPR